MAKQFPDWRGIVLQDGHVEAISGPRCMVKMSEGPYVGRYLVARTAEVLTEGTPILFDQITRRATPRCGAPGCDNPTDLGLCDECDQWVTDEVALLNRTPVSDGKSGR